MNECVICETRCNPRELTRHKGQLKCRECMCQDTDEYLEATANRAMRGASEFSGVQTSQNQFPWSLRGFNKQLREAMQRHGIPVGDDRYRRHEVSNDSP